MFVAPKNTKTWADEVDEADGEGVAWLQTALHPLLETLRPCDPATHQPLVLDLVLQMERLCCLWSPRRPLRLQQDTPITQQLPTIPNHTTAGLRHMKHLRHGEQPAVWDLAAAAASSCSHTLTADSIHRGRGCLLDPAASL